ncbi:MAG: metal ABC transporter permease [Parachlamydiales bacterium]|nr:metal ABC transporter permease [Parachlamydiales bacterium]
MIIAYSNPYTGNDFGQFFITFFYRFYQFMTGQLQWKELVSDEIQLLVLSGIALASALVGSFLVLRKMAMLANALSHTILLGIVLAFIITRHLALGEELSQGIDFRAMLIASVVTGIATTFLTEFFHKTARLQEDASIGLVFTSLFALGILLVTVFTRNAHIGTEVVMGNADALHIDDIGLAWKIFLGDAIIIILFFKEFQATTFDIGFSRAVGISTPFFNYLLMILVSATAIGAFRAVGVLMVLAFLVAPALSARLLTNSLKKLLWIAMGLSVLATFCGVALARHLLSVYDMPLSTGGVIVCMLVVIYIVAIILSPNRGVLARILNQRAVLNTIGTKKAQD